MLLIAIGALLTVLVEGLVFLLAREYRNRRFLVTTAIVNLTTNLSLNLFCWSLHRNLELLSFPVVAGETVVWILEFFAYGLLFRFSWKLLGFVCLANAITYSMSFFFD